MQRPLSWLASASMRAALGWLTLLRCCCRNITKYQNDPEIMKVLEKVTEIFAPAMQQQGQK